MKKIAWITDSTCSLDPEFAKENDIYILPMGISFGDETFKEGIDITEDIFYEKLTSSKELPKTSQPSLGVMLKLYEELKKEYEMGIAIHLSSALSGTLSSSKQAAEMADFHVEFVDSKLLSLPMSAMICKGQEMIINGMTVAETVSKLRDLSGQNELYAMIGSLDQLYKGGRVGSIQFLLGSILQIKPILKFEDGKLVPYEKVRTQKKALSYVLSRLKDDIMLGSKINEVYLLHANAPDMVSNLEDEVREILPDAKIVSGSIGSTIGVHAGAGTIGVSWFKE